MSIPPEQPTPAGPAARPVHHHAWEWQVTALSIVLGMMLALALRTTGHLRMLGLTNRHGVPAAYLTNYRRQNEKLQQEVKKLRDQVTEFRENTKTGTRNSDLLRRELEEQEALAGLAPVKGPGLKITLKNCTTPVLPGTRPADYLVADQDLTGLINELFAAGAEAVAAGDANHMERIVVSSAVRASTPNMVVNGQTLSAPYTILAIGNPKELKASLEMPDGIVQARSLDILKMITVEESQHLVLPAHAGDTPPSTVAVAH